MCQKPAIAHLGDRVIISHSVGFAGQFFDRNRVCTQQHPIEVLISVLQIYHHALHLFGTLVQQLHLLHHHSILLTQTRLLRRGEKPVEQEEETYSRTYSDKQHSARTAYPCHDTAFHFFQFERIGIDTIFG